MSHQAKGGKVRRGGLAERVQRVARVTEIAARLKDPDADAIARHVYAVAVALKGTDVVSQIPLSVEAPLTAACETAATGILRREGMEVTPENVELATSFLIAGWMHMVIHADASGLASYERDQQQLGNA